MTGGLEYLEEVIGQIEEHFSNNEDMNHHTSDNLISGLGENAFSAQPEMGIQHESDEISSLHTDTYDDHFQEYNHEDVQPYSFSHDGNGSDANRNHTENVPLGGYYNNDEDHTYHWTSDGSNTDEAGNVIYYS